MPLPGKAHSCRPRGPVAKTICARAAAAAWPSPVSLASSSFRRLKCVHRVAPPSIRFGDEAENSGAGLVPPSVTGKGTTRRSHGERHSGGAEDQASLQGSYGLAAFAARDMHAFFLFCFAAFAAPFSPSGWPVR